MRTVPELQDELWRVETNIAEHRRQVRVLLEERRRLRDELFLAQHRDARYTNSRIGAMKRFGSPPLRIVRKP